MANTNLNSAQAANQDEFYTQYADIEREVLSYVEYDPNVFRGKTILLPCDDPEWSNFTRFFARRFEEFGIKKLISTSYAPASKMLKKAISHLSLRLMHRNSTHKRLRHMGRYLFLNMIRRTTVLSMMMIWNGSI